MTFQNRGQMGTSECTVQLFTLNCTELTYKCTAVLLIQAQCVHHKCVKQVSSCSANWTKQNACTQNNKVYPDPTVIESGLWPLRHVYPLTPTGLWGIILAGLWGIIPP